jgi:hypothetical protein
MLKARLKEWLDANESAHINAAWITITGGDSVTKAEGGGLRVPKRDLASAPLVLMQNKQLKIAEGLELAPVLKRELLNFKVKINIATGHDSYEAWREGDHDDLVLAGALAAWAATRDRPRRQVRVRLLAGSPGRRSQLHLPRFPGV